MKIGLNYKCESRCQPCENAEIHVKLCCFECKLKKECNKKHQCSKALETCTAKEKYGVIIEIDFNELNEHIK